MGRFAQQRRAAIYGIMKYPMGAYFVCAEATSMNRRQVKWLLFGLVLAAGVVGRPTFAATNDLEYCVKGTDAAKAGETDLAISQITRCIAKEI